MKIKIQLMIIAMSVLVPVFVIFLASRIGVSMPPMLGFITVGLCLAIGLTANHILVIAIRKMDQRNTLLKQMRKNFIDNLEVTLLGK